MSTVIITVLGNRLLGGCMYNLGCLVGIIPMLVFVLCEYDV